jgi:NAD(P)-dependent dehydrogenase (short-subunit alcohol dehydrogenase family)
MAKTIFITGASTGIGKATALYFAAKGWDVIATMRNPRSAPELADNPNISLQALDVTDTTQINEVVKAVTSKGNVDVVVNNAGYGTVGPLEGTTDEDLGRIINTNLVGVIQLTRAFIPHFRQNKADTFITISSIGGLVAYPFFSLYHATKWAIEGWTESMAFELSRFGIHIKTVQPGPTKTDFAGSSLVIPEHPAYEAIFDKFKPLFFSEETMSSLAPPSDVSEVIFEAATDNKNQLRYLVGPVTHAEYDKRISLGAEGFHWGLDQAFFQ